MSEEQKENSIENSNDSPFVDFSDLDEQVKNENKEKKEYIKKEIATEKETKKAIESEANNKLAEVLEEKEIPKTKPKKDEEKTVKTEKSESAVTVSSKKKDSDIVLEADSEVDKRDAEIPISDDSIQIPSEEEESLMNSIDPKSRMHRVITDDDKNEEKEDIVVDYENKEKIVTEDTLSEKDIKEKENRRMKLEEMWEKRTGFKVYGDDGGIPFAYASDNPNVKALREYDIPTDKIKPIANDDENLKKSFMEQYITLTNAKDSTVVDHRITRFPCLLSGYYAEMTDFSIGELTSMIRILRSTEYDFAYKFQQELITLYNHISWTSLKQNGEKLTFEEWLKATKFKDLDMFYYGAYDATYPGISKYDITCGNCHSVFTVEKSNRGLAYLLQNGNDPMLKDTFIKDVLMERTPASELKKTLIYKKANTNFDEKVIKPHNIRISYGCPTLMDILEYLSVFKETLTDIEDFEALIDEDMEGHNILTLFTLIKSITVPVKRGVNQEGKTVLGFYKVDTEIDDDVQRVENRKYIISILKSLPEKEFADLFTGKELAERKRLIGITTILHNITCTNCNANIARIPIDMRGNFFTKTVTTVDQIEQF